MAVRLGKITEHPASQRVKLFGEQADVIASCQQSIEKVAGFVITTLQDVVIDEPEAASQKSAFARWQAIGWIDGFIAKNEIAIDQESGLDSLQRSPDSWVRRRKEADEGHQQQARIEAFGAVGLHEAIETGIESPFADFGVDLVGYVAPSCPDS
jgi:hypothetical protein